MRALQRLFVYFFVVIIGPVVSCSPGSQQVSYAPKETFWYTVIDSINTDYSSEIQFYLSEYLNRPLSFYLTDKSAEKGWPYYGEASPDQPISKDSLMIPHFTVHIIKPEKTLEDGKVLRIYLDSLSGGAVWFNEVISKRENGNESIFARPPLDRVRVSGMSEKEVGYYIAKSVIRSTFK